MFSQTGVECTVPYNVKCYTLVQISFIHTYIYVYTEIKDSSMSVYSVYCDLIELISYNYFLRRLLIILPDNVNVT